MFLAQEYMIPGVLLSIHEHGVRTHEERRFFSSGKALWVTTSVDTTAFAIDSLLTIRVSQPGGDL